MSRRIFPAVALGLAAALAIAGCSGGDETPTAAPTTPGSDTVTQGTVPLTVAMPNGQLTNNSNPFSPDSAGNKTGYTWAIYEPLVQTNNYADTDPVPWLASAYTWSDDFTSVTFTARDGVQWSDGEPFTAEDIAYTFTFVGENQAANPNAFDIKDVAVSGSDVTVTFGAAMFTKEYRVLQQIILPKHIWSAMADPLTDLNQTPVGTGPYVLTTWTNQAVTLDTNPTYWGGTPAAPQLQYSSYTDNSALLNALLAGDVQWTWTFIPDWENVWIAKDPEHNNFFTPTAIGSDVLYLNNETKPFNDPVFRKALNMVIDRQAIFDKASSKAFPQINNVTGLPEPAADAYIADEYKGQNVSVDVDGAKKLLTDNGYTYKGDELYDPSGERVSFKLSDPAGWTDYIDSLTLIASDAQKIGADAKVDGQEQDAWFTNIAAGDFQASLHWTDGGNTPWDMYRSILDGAQYVKLGEAANWNFGRYNNQEATDALGVFASSSDPAERAAAITTVQEHYVNDMPSIVVRGRPDSAEYTTINYTGFPNADDPYSGPQPTGPQASQILMKLRVNK